MALSVAFDMQRTTELRTADSSLENTFQPASNCMTVNESQRQASAISTNKSSILSALMLTYTTAKQKLANTTPTVYSKLSLLRDEDETIKIF